MSFIVVWRKSQKEPQLNKDSRGFLETYVSYDEAELAAKDVETEDSEYSDYQIFELAVAKRKNGYRVRIAR